jgi:hypothetical protein
MKPEITELGISVFISYNKVCVIQVIFLKVSKIETSYE